MKSNNNKNKDYLRHRAYQNRSNRDLLSLQPWSVRTLYIEEKIGSLFLLVSACGGGEDLCYSSKVHARVKRGPVGRSHATLMRRESGKEAGYWKVRSTAQDKRSCWRDMREGQGGTIGLFGHFWPLQTQQQLWGSGVEECWQGETIWQDDNLVMLQHTWVSCLTVRIQIIKIWSKEDLTIKAK